MKKFDFKRLIPHLIAVVIFLVVASVYCKPAFQGEVVNQHDTQGWMGMAQQSYEFNEEHGHFPLWTNSLFAGMPAYQIYLDSRTKISTYYAHYIFTLGLPKPVNFFFLACISFYFLCIVAGANPWLGILGGLSYAYSTFDPIIISVGHDTQMFSIGYAPAVIGGLLLLLKRRYWAGFAVTTLFTALLLMQNHVQVVYYTLIIAFLLFAAFLFKSVKEKKTKIVAKASLIGLVAGIIGFACSAVTWVPTYDYAKESMRGGRSELTVGDTTVKTKGGLDKDYAFRYSLGIPETLTFMVPALYGGSNGGGEFKSETKFTEEFAKIGMSEDQALQYENAYSYWGEQPGTSGPVYLGAVICLLFIFGALYLKGWLKWWLVATSAIGVILAFGSNLSSINFFLFDHLPYYNKFRAPTMALIIPQFCFPLLAVLGLQKLTKHIGEKEVLKKLKQTAIVSGSLIVVLGFFYMSASFEGPNDKALQQNFTQAFQQQGAQEQQAVQMGTSFIKALQSDRQAHMGGDLVRSMILMALAWGVLYLLINGKLKQKMAFTTLIVLSGFDLLGIGTRYLNYDSFITQDQFDSVWALTDADRQILADPDHANFRVFNQTVDSFNDASTSYHHNSVGGYHAAKLALYNDLILHQLSKGNMEVFDMLNTRYFIVPGPQGGQPVARLNPNAFGNVWLVKGVKLVADPNAEMSALDNTDLRDTAVVEEKYQNQIKAIPMVDSTAKISLEKNLNDEITYSYQSNSPQVAVFSEIYYPRGWNVTVDGKPAEYFRANYVLRGMYLPAGNHQIEFKFQPQSFAVGRAITIVASLLTYLILIASVFFILRNKKEPEDIRLDTLE